MVVAGSVVVLLAGIGTVVVVVGGGDWKVRTSGAAKGLGKLTGTPLTFTVTLPGAPSETARPAVPWISCELPCGIDPAKIWLPATEVATVQQAPELAVTVTS